MAAFSVLKLNKLTARMATVPEINEPGDEKVLESVNESANEGSSEGDKSDNGPSTTQDGRDDGPDSPFVSEGVGLGPGRGRSSRKRTGIVPAGLSPTPVRPTTPIPASTIAMAIPNPPFRRYYSDHTNKGQRVNRLLEWWRELPEIAKVQMSAHVYRDWPVLLDPDEGSGEFKYIDVIIEAPDTDLAFGDAYGAGDYHFFLNTGGDKGSKRTLAEGYIKGHRDLKSQPPADKRITETGPDGLPKYVDFNDPQNKTYVEFLRTRGMIPELFKRQKEEADMAQEGVVKQLMDQNKMLMDKATAAPAPPAAPVYQGPDMQTAAALAELRGSMTALREMIANGRGGNNDASSMLELSMRMASQLTQANDPTKYLEMIGKLNETVSKLQMDRMEDRLKDLSDRLERGHNSGGGPAGDPPGPNKATGLAGLMEELRSVKGFIEEVGGGKRGDVEEAAAPAWMTAIAGVAPHLASIVGNVVQAYALSKVQPGMMPPPPQAPAPVPQPTTMPSQMPAPGMGPVAVPDPALAAPTMPPGMSDPITTLLFQIQIPLVNYIEDGQSGEDFAFWFQNSFGEPLYYRLIEYGPKSLAIPAEQAVMLGLENFPPIKIKLDQIGFTGEALQKFVQEFVGFDRAAYTRREGIQDQEDDGNRPA